MLSARLYHTNYEGIVWYPVSLANKQLALPITDFASFSFKTKGISHLTVKVYVFCEFFCNNARQQQHGATQSLVRLTALKAKDATEFADMFLTRARMLQGITECCSGTVFHSLIFICSELTLNGKDTFVEWVLADVKKESGDELDASCLSWEQALENYIIN